MMALKDLLERADRLYRDWKLPSVKEWKAKTGGLAVGYMPVWVPREVLHAQGVLPVGLMGAGEDLEIIRGDAYYQSYICHIPRSTIELALNGSLDCLDGMLFPAICDVIRNLSGIWKLTFKDKLVRYSTSRRTSTRRWAGSSSGTRSSRWPPSSSAAARRSSSPRRSAARSPPSTRTGALVRGLYELRRQAPHKVPTHEVYVLLRAGLVIPVEEHTEMLKAYRAAVEADTTRRPLDQARVVLAGSFCEQPPLALLKTLERSGCYIVDDDLVQVHRWIQNDVPLTGDPLDALVNASLSDAIPHPTRYSDSATKGDDLVDRVRASGAGGVLFCAPSFCDPALLDQPMAIAAIEKAGIPWTAFKYAENGGQFQVIREQAGTFADSIKLWSAA